ncbi:NAD(P)/FAD-dependent oxidoreductase [Methylogaea oryzae]|uniref:NAD(P)/FAD-dependent oxidoreductase n=1 Tax=Methylogaea oryzae TaxID=1295382 RepID=UPI0030D8847C
MAPGRAQSGIQRAIRRRRRRHLLRRQAAQRHQGPAPAGPQGADRIRQSRRARRNPLHQQAPHRHLPPGGHGGTHARHHGVPGRGNPLPKQGGGFRHRGRPAARRHIGRRRNHRHAARGAGGGPQRPRYLPGPAPARRLHGSQALLHRLPHRHPQSLIDRCRFGDRAGHPLLGAADYKLVHHCKNGRSVYSFCMCPGGTVVAAASEPGRVVTNGMSQYSRNERNANSGIVVGITPEDYPGSPLAGIELQRRWEEQAYKLGGENYQAPGQLVGDFLAGRPSTQFGSVQPSYTPGVHPTDLATALPDYAIAAIREALPAFDKQIKGYAMHDAVLTGVETRTSSPVRIKRGEDFQSLNTRGLYPAGEGAGYAGGILSAAVDGIKVAEALALDMAG